MTEYTDEEVRGFAAELGVLKDHLTAQIVRIDPELARALLRLNTRNRTRNRTAEAAYASRMTRRAWHAGSSLYISQSGRLIDGQTRLFGQVSTGTSEVYTLVCGADEGLQKWLDRQRRRTHAQQLALEEGAKNTSPLAAIIRLAARDSAGARGSAIFNSSATVGVAAGYPESDQISEFYHAWRDELEKAVRLSDRASGKVGITGSVLGLLAWKGLILAGEETTEDFFEGLTTGAMLAADSPIKILRDKYLRVETERGSKRQRTARTTIGREYTYAEAVKAWNLWRAGKPASVNRITLRSHEPFPEML